MTSGTPTSRTATRGRLPGYPGSRDKPAGPTRTTDGLVITTLATRRTTTRIPARVRTAITRRQTGRALAGRQPERPAARSPAGQYQEEIAPSRDSASPMRRLDAGSQITPLAMNHPPTIRPSATASRIR
ncbi:MAG TPA: hypothetical protein VFQ44_14855 [Streptosporangiaceae bacterium]|nr:hypothetical protein [Streptosporangiaceae bacterium]